MSVKTVSCAYVAPDCEVQKALLEELLCQSPDGTTEDFGEIEDFTW